MNRSNLQICDVTITVLSKLEATWGVETTRTRWKHWRGELLGIGSRQNESLRNDRLGILALGQAYAHSWIALPESPSRSPHCKSDQRIKHKHKHRHTRPWICSTTHSVKLRLRPTCLVRSLSVPLAVTLGFIGTVWTRVYADEEDNNCRPNFIRYSSNGQRECRRCGLPVEHLQWTRQTGPVNQTVSF